MPFIEVRYDPQYVDGDVVVSLLHVMEETLRESIALAREDTKGKRYGISTEADPFNRTTNQPDLRVFIFYHDDWNFTENELQIIVKCIGAGIKRHLVFSGLLDVTCDIRLYKRTGHAVTKIR
jgi:hypothetical protein